MTTEIFMASGGGLVHVTVAPGEYIIGRDGESADIHIDDPSVSASHARLVVDKETVCIQDLDSENGTFIDGEPAVGLTNLYDGQTAVLGAVSLRVRQNVDPHLLGEGPRYVRGGMVAHGGMGAIHEARQSAMGRKVAMKVMLHSWSARSVKRFLDEARITGMLEHPNIVPVHEMGVDEEDQFFYTMKFVKGATLSEVLAALAIGKAESLRKFPLAALLTIFQKVCDAVAFAHSRGVWHRDLKPENIMIGDFGEVLVMDWGLAKESGFVAGESAPPDREAPAEADVPATETMAGRTMEGTVLGTPAYMSPEQARGQTSDVDHRSDIYALGAILHEILYLQPPVPGKSRDKVLEKVAAGVRELPAQTIFPHLPAQRVPASLEAVSRKATAHDSDKRYQRVQDLQADINAYQSGFATSAESAGLAKHLLLFVKRNRSVSLAVFIALVTLVVFSLFFAVNLVHARNRAEAAKNAETAARLLAEDNQRKAEEALNEALDAKGKAKAADLNAKVARTGEQAALAEADKAKSAADQGQKMLEETRENSARQFSRMARAAVAEGRSADALRLFGTAVDYAPADANVLLQHGLALLALGDYAGAAGQLERALQSDPPANAREELAMAKKLQASQKGDAKADPALLAGLDRFLMARGHASFVRLIDARPVGAVLGEAKSSASHLQLDGEDLIASRLGELVNQPEWRKDRIQSLGDGAFALDLRGLELKKLPDLADTGVVSLDLEGTKTKDISQLRGLSLRSLNLAGTRVADLSPLANMPELSNLKCSAEVKDLSPLRGTPIETLDIAGSRVESLEPLRDARLRYLSVAGCEIPSLEPVAAQPLRELNAEVVGPFDISSIENMDALVKLRLPRRTGMPDLGGLPLLEEIFLPDLRPDAVLSGEEFRELDALRMQFWERYGKQLESLGLKNFGPERLLVRQKDTGMELDLRGTGITDLGPLSKIPLHRLLLDDSAEPINVDVLGAHPTLRHLSLEGAWVPAIGKLASNRQLASLVVSRDAKDTPLLAKHPGLRLLGYTLAKDGISPSGTVGDFFSPRRREDGDSLGEKSPKYSFAFDAAADGADGWRLFDTSSSPPTILWMADPPTEGGVGGGFISFYERKGNSAAAYFVSSPAITRSQRDLYGGLIEFRLRVGRELKEEKRASVVIVVGNTTLHHTTSARPGLDWTTVTTSLTAEDSWLLVGPTGEAATATETDIREALARVREIRIQAEFSGENLEERTDLDDVRIWDNDTAEARRSQLGISKK